MGRRKKFRGGERGGTGRLDEMQAPIWRVKLRHFSNGRRARQSHAAEYNRLLSQIPGVMPPLAPEAYEHVYHQYTIRIEQRDALRKFLSKRKIGSTVYYPYPLHLQPLYSALGHKPGDFPHAARSAQQVLSLPMYPD